MRVIYHVRPNIIMQLRIPRHIDRKYARAKRDLNRVQRQVTIYNRRLIKINAELNANRSGPQADPRVVNGLQREHSIVFGKLQRLTNSRRFDGIHRRWLYLSYLKRHGLQINLLSRIITRAVDRGRLGDATAQQLRDMLTFSINRNDAAYRRRIRTVVELLGKHGVVKPLLRPKR